ncbi:MAG: glycosyltransferase family 2 protein [Rhodobacteraceae bacterium]|nr:glycosyltransferase family 2 protein [Paracoccaceae bacterium]
MAEPTLLTIILNYRTPDMTMQALEAALREMEGLNGEVVVVDNDSQDGSFEKMSTAVMARGLVNVRVVQSGRNGGFGAGNNVGIRTGLSNGRQPDLIYILNSDAFPGPDSIRQLMAHLRANPETGLAGSYIHGPGGEPHITAFRFPSILSEFEGAAKFGPISKVLKSFAQPLPLPRKTRTVDWVAGASLMIRRNVLDEIGLFDETFFLYFEETDLCLRAKRAGRNTVYVRESEVAHIGSVSTGMKTWTKMPDYWFDSRWHYFAKNRGKFYAALATGAHLFGGTIHWIVSRLRKKPRSSPQGSLRHLTSHAVKSAGKPKPKQSKSFISKETRIAGHELK